MKSKVVFILAIAATLGVGLVASARGVTVTVSPDAARTYCATDPLVRATNAVEAQSFTPPVNPPITAFPVFTNDHSVNDAAGTYTPAGNIFGNELVWRVIGSLPQDPPGEAYCGYLAIPPTRIGSRNWANGIQDCVGALRYAITSSGWKKASLHWGPGSGLGQNTTGTRLSLSVSICTVGNPDTFLDDEPVPNAQNTDKDCIVDRLDFGGGSFAAIADAQIRKADNTVGIVGGYTGINYLDLALDVVLPLSSEAVAAINNAAGKSLVFMVRCADTFGHMNGFLGGQDNVLVVHDDDGIGGLGSGTMDLVLEN